MKRRTIYFALWILLLLPTLFFVLGTSLTIAVPEAFEGVPGATVVLGVCTAILGLPTLAFLLLWYREWGRDRMLREMGNLLRAYRDVPIADLARQFDKTERETEILIGAAVTEGYAKGWIDPGTRAFQNAEMTPHPPAHPVVVPPLGVPIGAAEPAREVPSAIVMRYCRKCGSRVYPRDGQDAVQCWNCGNVQAIEG